MTTIGRTSIYCRSELTSSTKNTIHNSHLTLGMDRVGIQHSADRNPFVSNAHLQMNKYLISSFYPLLIKCMIDSLLHMNTFHPVVDKFSAISESLKSNRPSLPSLPPSSPSHPMPILSGSSHNESHVFYRWFQLF